MKKTNVVIVTHVLIGNNQDIAGPPHKLYTYCKKNNIDAIFIRHGIFGESKTFVTTLSNKKETHQTLEGAIKQPEMLVRFWEGYITVKLIWRFLDKHTLYIGVDPLNSVWGLL